MTASALPEVALPSDLDLGGRDKMRVRRGVVVAGGVLLLTGLLGLRLTVLKVSDAHLEIAPQMSSALQMSSAFAKNNVSAAAAAGEKTAPASAFQSYTMDNAINFNDPATPGGDLTDVIADTPFDSNLLDSPLTGVTDTVIYNRVPKCGSKAAQRVFGSLSKINGYRCVSYLGERLLDADQQRDFVQGIMNKSHPLLYDSHLYFVDFTQFGEEQPVYINLIRDPFERLVSIYYYTRFQSPRSRIVDMPGEKRNRTYDECVRLKLEECISPERYSNFFFFCGQEEVCRNSTERALKRAKQVVSKYFAVVGVTEEMDLFYTVLEWIIPDFFRGAHSVYIEGRDFYKAKFRNPRRRPYAEATRAAMLPKLELEYAFYYWVRQRFHLQFDRVTRQMRARDDSRTSAIEEQVLRALVGH